MTNPTLTMMLTLAVAAAGIANAEQRAPEDYLSDDAFVLQVRYCDCQAVEPGGSSDGLRPEFLSESTGFSTGLTLGEEGFVSSDDLAIGYRVQPVSDTPGVYHLRYSGTSGNGSGQGTSTLVVGEWLNIFGVEHRTDSGSQYFNVAIRLVEPGDL